MKISYQNKHRFYYSDFGKLFFFINFLINIIKTNDRQICTVAFLQTDANPLIDDFDSREVEIWTTQIEREEKLKKLGI